jgi:hypothetical protein
MLRGHTVRAYEGFLELPVFIVLAVMWVGGRCSKGRWW